MHEALSMGGMRDGVGTQMGETQAEREVRERRKILRLMFGVLIATVVGAVAVTVGAAYISRD